MNASLPSRLRVDLLLVVVAASWGSTYLVAKELVSADSVVAVLSVRMLLAAAVMVGVVASRRRRVSAAERRTGTILGVLLATVFAFETFGIADTSATNAGIIISLTSVFTPLLDSFVSKRRLPRAFMLAATLAVFGVVLLSADNGFHAPTLGDLLVLVAAVARAVHTTTMHRLTASKPMDSLHLTTVQLSTCAVLFTVISAFTGESIPQYVVGLRPNAVGLLLYLVVVCTVFAFFVQTWAVRRTSPSRVSLLLGTEPVWAAAIGIVVAHDRVALIGYLGIALVLAATAWGRRVEQRHRAGTIADAPPVSITEGRAVV